MRRPVHILFQYFLVIQVILWMLAGCATPGFPTGGARDQTPPRVISQTPSHQSTNVSSSKLTLVFDEFVQLQNPRQNLLISPPPKDFPEVNVRKNTITLDFKGGLEPNTTYSLQFGDNIKDNNEGNALQNFQWVFSTGEYLDSLTVSGKVREASGKDLPANTWILLYSNLDDTAFISQRPYYFTKAEKSTGTFRFDHIKAGSYKIYALEDRNNNFYYDLPTESIAFLDTVLELVESITVDNLVLFEPEPERQSLTDFSTSLKSDSWFLKLSKPLPPSQKWALNPLSDSVVHTSRLSSDRQTITTWLKRPYLENVIGWEISLEEGKIWDTIYVQPERKESSGGLAVRGGQSTQTTAAPRPAAPTSLSVAELDTIRVRIQQPLEDVRTEWIQFTRDSLPEDIEVIATLSPDSMSLNLFTLLPAGIYRMEMLPGAINYFTTGDNSDTLKYTLTVSDTNNLGSLAINVILSTDYQTIITVKDATKTVYNHIVPPGAEVHTIQLKHVPPGRYTLEAIEDRDANGLYSRGSYFEKRQPERVFVSTPVDLKAGWEQETDIAVKFGP